MDYITNAVCGCIAQGCCWYSIFSWCGCMDTTHIQIIEPQQPTPQSPNPFTNPNAPKDAHLQPAYK